MNLKTIHFENNTLRIINQQLLPHKLEFCELKNLDDVISAITSLIIRGAPAIGIVAAYGLFIHARNLILNNSFSKELFLIDSKRLESCRPTAVNLSWAINMMTECTRSIADTDVELILEKLKDTALFIHNSDIQTCESIGNNGSALISDGDTVLTHCNAGSLATGGIGTALGIIYKAQDQNKKIHVFVDETRPVGQGARLTIWELQQNKVQSTLIADNMAASLMQKKQIQLIIVGADRISKNGDVANKIGTYSLAVLADYHKIPFYVAAPFSTFDIQIDSGSQIPIEMRASHEILEFWNIRNADIQVYNPAFDITPSDLITAIITERGIINKPISKNIFNYVN